MQVGTGIILALFNAPPSSRNMSEEPICLSTAGFPAPICKISSTHGNNSAPATVLVPAPHRSDTDLYQ